jgi:uncharacterized protein (DUF433 family)
MLFSTGDGRTTGLPASGKGEGVKMLDQSIHFGRITIDPAVCNGKPTVRGKRITVQTVLEFLSAGESREEILRQYPSLEPGDIDACLDFAPKRRSTAA